MDAIQGHRRRPAAPFVSRGDNSGTHKKELDLWKKAEIDPAGQAWYLETGQGMGATLTIASEKAAYTLTDRATYLANQDNLELDILFGGRPDAAERLPRHHRQPGEVAGGQR